MVDRVRRRLVANGDQPTTGDIPSDGVDLRAQVATTLSSTSLFFDYAGEIERRARRAWQNPLGGEPWDISDNSPAGKPVRLDPEVEDEIVIAADHLCDCNRSGSRQDFLTQVTMAMRALQTPSPACIRATETPAELAVRKQMIDRFPCALTFIEFDSAVRVIAALATPPDVRLP
jgi:hypothetical protein